MQIERMAPMEPLSMVLNADRRSGKVAAAEDAAFSDILSNAIGAAAKTDQTDRAGMAALLSGEDISIDESMNQSTQAELALNLAIQIRNKVLDAYNEVMRMSV